jgi:hypothetical protein
MANGEVEKSLMFLFFDFFRNKQKPRAATLCSLLPQCAARVTVAAKNCLSQCVVFCYSVRSFAIVSSFATVCSLLLQEQMEASILYQTRQGVTKYLCESAVFCVSVQSSATTVDQADNGFTQICTHALHLAELNYCCCLLLLLLLLLLFAVA